MTDELAFDAVAPIGQAPVQSISASSGDVDDLMKKATEMANQGGPGANAEGAEKWLQEQMANRQTTAPTTQGDGEEIPFDSVAPVPAGSVKKGPIKNTGAEPDSKARMFGESLLTGLDTAIFNPLQKLQAGVANYIANPQNLATQDAGEVTPEQQKALDLLGAKVGKNWGPILKASPDKLAEAQDKWQTIYGLDPEEVKKRDEAVTKGEEYSGPVEGMLGHSAAKDILGSLYNPNASNTLLYHKVQEVMHLQDITAHPDKYDPETVEAAQSILKQYEDIKKKGTWENTKDAIKSMAEHPLALVNTTLADPELFLAPEVKLGTEVYAGKMLASGEAASKAAQYAKLADSLAKSSKAMPEVEAAARQQATKFATEARLAAETAEKLRNKAFAGDVASAAAGGAAINTGLAAGQQEAEQGYITPGSLPSAAMLGAGLGAGLTALGGRAGSSLGADVAGLPRGAEGSPQAGTGGRAERVADKVPAASQVGGEIPFDEVKPIASNESGQIDKRLLATGAAGAIGATAAGALAPEDQKKGAALLGGAAGLLVGGLHSFGESIPGRGFGNKERGMFAGPTSKTWNPADVRMATKLEEIGKTPEEIHTATGMSRDAAGNWVKEISDKGMSLVPKENPIWDKAQVIPVPLKDVVKHEELAKAYPELMDNIKVKVNPDLKSLGSFNTETNVLTIRRPADMEQYAKTKPNYSPLSVIAHEVQHGIQTIEGFPGGTSVGAEAQKLNPIRTYLNERQEVIYNKWLDAKAKNDTASMEKYDRMLDNIAEQFDTKLDKKAQWNYTANAGEVQARNVQNRLRLSEEELASKSPRITEDVPLANQVVNKQAGNVDPELLKKLGGASALALGGATVGAYLADPNKKYEGAGLGAMAAFLARGAFKKGLVPALDKGLGLISTRIKNMSEPLWWRTIKFEADNLRKVGDRFHRVDNFLVKVNKLPQAVKDELKSAILTGDRTETRKVLSNIGDESLNREWENVRSVLGEVGHELVQLNRFKPTGTGEYFPRIVKDYDGLMKAINAKNEPKGHFIDEILKNEEAKSIKETGKSLSDESRSKIINSILQMGEDYRNYKPGYIQDRSINKVIPEYAKYYEDLPNALHRYLRSATQDIEKAKFFGKDLSVIKDGDQQYTNDDTSIGNLVARLHKEGKITGRQAEELGSMLRARFSSGEQGSHPLLQGVKDIGNAALLGNPISAANQLGDVIAQSYTQGVLPTITAVARQLSGKKNVNLRQLGLADHVAEEFNSTSKTSKVVRKAFKFGLFSGVDEFGKNTSLNAALSKFRRLVNSPAGLKELKRMYGEALGDEFPQLVQDIEATKKGEPASELLNTALFAELSRSQPISRIELPEMYLKMPNGRIMYWLHTFQLKMLDLARRDVYNEFKQGNIVRGARNLVKLTAVLGIAGASADQIQNFIQGKPFDLSWAGVLTNALKTYGLSQYTLDKAFGVDERQAKLRELAGQPGNRVTKAEPVSALVDMALPPHKMFDELLRLDPKAIRYIPVVGPIIYSQMMNNGKRTEEEKEASKQKAKETRRRNKAALYGG